jgi:hypothetical protein
MMKIVDPAIGGVPSGQNNCVLDGVATTTLTLAR